MQTRSFFIFRSVTVAEKTAFAHLTVDGHAVVGYEQMAEALFAHYNQFAWNAGTTLSFCSVRSHWSADLGALGP